MEFITQNKKLLAGLAFLAALVGAWPAFTGTRDFIKDQIDGYLLTHTTEVIADIKNEANTKASYRFGTSLIYSCSPDSVLLIDQKIYIEHQYLVSSASVFQQKLDSLELDKAALQSYLVQISKHLWDEMGPQETLVHNGIPLKQDINSGTIYHRYHGLMFEAYYKGSCDCYHFQDSYGVERIAE